MKYIFNNIGPIKEAKLELGDLTVIAGGNNTGKTYIAYAMHGIRQDIISRIMGTLYVYDRKFSDTENKRHVVKGTIPYHVLIEYLQNSAEHSAKLFSKKGLTHFFATSENSFPHASVKLMIKKTDFPKDFSISGKIDSDSSRAEVNLSENKGVITYEVKFDANSKLTSISSPRRRSYFAHFSVILVILTDILKISNDFVLPAERFGISLFYRQLDSTKADLLDSLSTLSDKELRKQLSEIPYTIGNKASRYGIPIKEHIRWNRDLDQTIKQISDLSKHNLFENIKQMMDGDYRYNKDQIIFVPHASEKSGDDLSLHTTSASVRELSSLYFYLKHTASPDELIIIDEPESHLDTENQIKMARLLVHCVNAGIRVLITTHSDYIVQELNNMIMLHSVDPKNKKIRQLCKKQGYNEHHSLDKKRVKGYLCEKGKLVSCKVDNRGMDLKWFDKTIEKINSVSYTLDGCIPEDDK